MKRFVLGNRKRGRTGLQFYALYNKLHGAHLLSLNSGHLTRMAHPRTVMAVSFAHATMTGEPQYYCARPQESQQIWSPRTRTQAEILLWAASEPGSPESSLLEGCSRAADMERT